MIQATNVLSSAIRNCVPNIAPKTIPRIMKNFFSDFGHVPATLPVWPFTRTR